MPVCSADSLLPKIGGECIIVKTQHPHLYRAYLEMSLSETFAALADDGYDIPFIRFTFDSLYGAGKEPGVASQEGLLPPFFEVDACHISFSWGEVLGQARSFLYILTQIQASVAA